MPLRFSRLLPLALVALCAANIAAGTIVYLGMFSPQAARQVVDGSIAAALNDFASLDARGWLILLQGAAVTSAILAIATLPAIALFMAAAARCRWRDTRAIMLAGASIGPLLLAAGLLALSSAFPRSLDHPGVLGFFVILAAAGAIASVVFWLIVRPALPWMSSPG